MARVCDHVYGKHIEVENVSFLLSGIPYPGHARTSLVRREMKGRRKMRRGRGMSGKPEALPTLPNRSRYKNTHRVKKCREIRPIRGRDLTSRVLLFSNFEIFSRGGSQSKSNLRVLYKAAFHETEGRKKDTSTLKQEDHFGFWIPRSFGSFESWSDEKN